MSIGERAAVARLGDAVDRVDTPAVLVDLDVLEANVRTMAEFAAAAGIALRPHCKTHKTLEIARRQVGAGASGLTVAKLDEAEAYLDDGHRDVFVANEVFGTTKWTRLAAMQRRGTVAVGVDDPAAAEGMAEVARREGVTIPLLIEIDCGLARAGLPPGDAAVELAELIDRLPGLELRGVFTHAGHAYAADGPARLPAIAQAEAAAVVETAERIRARGIACPVVSVGSTPTARLSGAVPGVTEIRPGNYVFNDRMQVALGESYDRCALTVVATVASVPVPDRAVCDAGSKTFALDRGAHGNDRLGGFGEDPANGAVLERLSEEHGVLRPGPAGVRIGDRLRFVPNHACTVANLARQLVGVRGGVVREVMDVVVPGGGR
jgi:D-serine deaminase-like pyridoxal phosphate-dependent protein